ncbi:hypothetical protein OAN307_c17810 [Octadecabacter antarcticus 307]|uniref:Uncharacterized protein n=1 Tax=Octadecabacter antarcticus 307 TaxID=391626 RepID=M9R4B5_9RHOB|nr:hypothetical protein [Octadecabacter antarcticus]AGI67444.1 hypothetical protein OAN307_c17810 [Octadecabacter antarcticus 307]
MVDRSFDWKISRDTSPPLHDLAELLSAFEIVEEVGPRYDVGKRLQQLEDGLFNGMRLRSIADGHPLNWINGFRQAKNEILKKIPVGSQSALDTVIGFKKLMAARTDLSWTNDSPVLLTDEYRIEQELVFVRSKASNEYVTGRPTLHCYAQISSDWARFFVELDAMDSAITTLTLRCLKEGRAICVLEEAPGPQLQVPSRWDTKSGLRGHVKSRFLLTCDLPEAWNLKKMDVLERADRKRKAEALRWLYAEYRRMEWPLEFLTKVEVRTLLETKFGMKTTKVRDEVWEEAPLSNWRGRGRRKNT